MLSLLAEPVSSIRHSQDQGCCTWVGGLGCKLGQHGVGGAALTQQGLALQLSVQLLLAASPVHDVGSGQVAPQRWRLLLQPPHGSCKQEGMLIRPGARGAVALNCAAR